MCTKPNPTVKIFRYIPEVDGFDVSDEYRQIAEDLGLTEWNPVVWIGRLFSMDNDVGEHWFDNWDLRDKKQLEAEKLGLKSDDLFFIEPDRFQDGRDGPCNTEDLRKRFWTDVLISLELSLDLLFEKARTFNVFDKQLLDGNPDDKDCQDDYIPDLEARIDSWRNRYEKSV